jgi:phosphoenolpyruvate carboxylase
MDHFGVAKTRIQKDSSKPNKRGKRVPYDLSARIDKLAKKVGTSDFSVILHTLRMVGNVGAHGTKVARAAMLDTYQLYEVALSKLFEDKNQTPKAIIKRLKAHRLM